MDPEHFSQYPQGSLIERACQGVVETQMLIFDADGLYLYEYMDDPEAERTPFLLHRAPSLEQFIEERSAASEETGAMGVAAETINTEEFRQWLETLISPDTIKEAASIELHRREIEGDETTMPCIQCEGEAYLIGNCSCVRAPVLEPGESWSSAGAPGDPDCQDCHGIGRIRVDCEVCSGCGTSPKYPRLTLRNEDQGTEEEVVLNVASLIANGALPVNWIGFEYVFEDGVEHSEKLLNFQASAWLDRCIASLGIDTTNVARIDAGYEDRLDADHHDINILRAYWWKHGDEAETSVTAGMENMSSHEVLELAQNIFRQVLVYSSDRTKDADGRVDGVTWTLRQLPSPEQRVEALKPVLASRGQRLGYALTDIGNMVVPAFYFLDSQGGVVKQFANSFFHDALEDAWAYVFEA